MKGQDTTVVIRASAGTGKTYQLTNRFLGLIKDGVRPDHILAVTFTRLAAGEILERVLLRLATASLDIHEGNALAKALHDKSFTRERCLNLLQELTRSLHRMRVETLDAYFAQLARSFSLEIGLPTSWEIIDEVQDQRLRSEALEATITEDSEKTIARLLKIIFQGEANRSITAELSSKVGNFYNVLKETDENAWHNFPNLPLLDRTQLQNAIDDLRREEPPAHGSAKKRKEKDVEVAELNDWGTFIRTGIGAKILAGETEYYRKEIPATLITAYQKLIDHAQAVFVNELKEITVANFDFLKRFEKHYEELKQRNRGIRFEDVTHSLTNLAKTADANEQNFRLDTEISHLLLDEFQDTSLRQWQIIRPMAERITDGRNMLFDTAFSSFFCVGDVKQAIYGWRGGRSEIFDALKKHLENTKDLPLNKSYRSAPTIINVVNRAFKNMSGHDNLGDVEAAVTQWCDEFPEHETELTELKGYVQLETAPLAIVEEGNISAEQQRETTFEFAADKIATLHELMPEKTIGVLLRQNKSVARIIYELRRKGVKASEERGGNPLTDSAAVQVILSLLRIADHPTDSIAAFHVATSPVGSHFGIDRATFRENVFGVSKSVRQKLMQMGYGAAVSQWADLLKPFSNSRDCRRMQQLVELAYRFENIGSIRTTEFLRFVSSEKIADPLVSNVRVMTVHQSKGLEFDIVVLPELETKIEGNPPSVVWSSEDPTESIDHVCIYRNKEIQAVLPPAIKKMFSDALNRQAVESLCLLYVAMTRAAHALYMIIAPEKSSEKSSGGTKKAKTFAGLLHQSLAPEEALEESTVLYQDGDEDWSLSQASKPDESDSVIKLPTSIRLAKSKTNVRFDFASPSGLEGGNVVPASQLLRFSNKEALARGTVIHGLFEEVKWIEKVPTDLELLEIAKRLGDGILDAHSQVTEFRRMLEREEIASVLTPAYYLRPNEESVIESLPDSFNLETARIEVHNERTFIVSDSGQMLAGTIDRLVLIYGGDQLLSADIVDFKTDRLDIADPNALQERAKHYQPQIEAYRRAVSSIFDLDLQHICARLLFVDAGLCYSFSPQASPSPA